MNESVIKIDSVTKDYGHGRGIFDVSMDIRRGKTVGFIGTNGSGKTTTIRTLLGFIKPDKGYSQIMGMDSWQKSSEIMKYVSYIPGEIAFPSLPTGTAFLKQQARYTDVKNFDKMNQIIRTLKLDTSADLKRMSKGMKQKTAITAALMCDKEILILDEPTTGLDPLMRDEFLNLVRQEKKKGKTILMSGHIFEEIEEVCDKVIMIKDGYMAEAIDLNEMKTQGVKHIEVYMTDIADTLKLMSEWKGARISADNETCIIIDIELKKLNQFIDSLTKYQVDRIRENHFKLEDYFMEIYGGDIQI